MQHRSGRAKSANGKVPRVSRERISLAEVMRRHAGVLGKLPGQEVEILANELGFERTSIFSVKIPGTSSQGSESSLQLLFSIMAFDKRSRPIATLSLLENYERVKDAPLSLIFLDTVQDTLVEYLKRRGAPLATYDEFNRFVDALRSMIEKVGSDVVWA